MCFDEDPELIAVLPYYIPPTDVPKNTTTASVSVSEISNNYSEQNSELWSSIECIIVNINHNGL